MSVDLDSDEGGSNPQTSTMNILIFLGIWAVSWWFFSGDWMCSANYQTCYQTWLIVGFFWSSVFIIFQVSWLYMKWWSPQVICNNYHTSFTGDYITAGDWYIIKCGGSKIGPIPGRDGILIFHKAAYNRLGEQVAVTIRNHENKFNELPKPVQTAIRRYKLRKPYRYGVIDEDQYRAKVSVAKKHKEVLEPVLGGLLKVNPSHLVVLLEEEFKLRTKFEKISDILMKSPEQIVEWANRLATKGELKQRVKEAVFGVKEEG